MAVPYFSVTESSTFPPTGAMTLSSTAEPRQLHSRSTRADLVFSSIASSAGLVSLLIVGLTAIFLFLETGGGSVAALIATQFGEASDAGRSGLVAAGLALFLTTFAVTILARTIVARAGKGAE